MFKTRQKESYYIHIICFNLKLNQFFDSFGCFIDQKLLSFSRLMIYINRHFIPIPQNEGFPLFKPNPNRVFTLSAPNIYICPYNYWLFAPNKIGLF